MVRNFIHKVAVRIARAAATRGYAAARISRLTSDWMTTLTSADEEIWKDLRALRARSRALARDDDYFKNYLRKLKNNVVGHCGMTMKVEAQLEPSTIEGHGNTKLQRDRKLNKQVESAWWTWRKKKYASASTKLSFVELERLCIESVAVDGEAIFRYIYDTNAFGFTLQQIDPDWLDEQFNEKLPNGNNVVMSVEMDRYDKPVRYWLTPPRHSYYGVTRDHGISAQGKRVPVDAEEILHCFISSRSNQTRGVPVAHTVIGRIKDLDRYEGAELTNKTVSASKMGFISPGVDSPVDLADLNDENTEQQTPILDAVEPGTLQKLPRGWTFSAFDPKSDDGTFVSFCKQVLRGIAAGLGTTYNTLTGDYESVNYSSLRAAALEEHDEWRALQHWMISAFHEPVYEAWLSVVAGSEFLPIAQSVISKVINAVFKPRGWAWVDPDKDSKANERDLAMGATTYTRIFADLGLDFEDEMEQAKYEREYIKSLGLEFTYGKNSKKKEDGGAGNKDSGKSAAAA
jgi:lambda family phage portal protein